MILMKLLRLIKLTKDENVGAIRYEWKENNEYKF